MQLPSNSKFGSLFIFVFGAFAIYFYINDLQLEFLVALTATCLMILTTIIAPNLLQPLNALWMKFGLLLGMVITPLLMILIFVVIFCPLAILMRLGGRDCLQIYRSEKSYWNPRNNVKMSFDDLKNQY